MFTFCKCFGSRSTEPFQSFDSKISCCCFGLLHSQMGNFEVLIVEAVEQEVEKIRNNCFGAFTFQKLCQMIVGSRKEFNKDFSNDSNTWLLDIKCLDIIKIIDDLFTKLLKSLTGWISFGHKLLNNFSPFAVNLICSSRYGLIRTHTVNAFHKDISEYCCVDSAENQCRRKFESRIIFQST